MKCRKISISAAIILVLSSIGFTTIQSVSASKVSINLIMPAQYSAYSSVPFPNCIDTIDDSTVVLHWVGSCGNNPFFENLKYYSDFGYHVQNVSGNVAANGESVVTLVKLGYTSSYDDVLRELLAKQGFVCPAGLSC